MRILAVSGSLRAGSHNTNLLRAAIEAAPRGDRGRALRPAARATCRCTTRISTSTTCPGRLRRLREEWGAADAILFATPEFNGSVPGGLKNAIDWASRPLLEAPLTNKTVAVIGASSGQFGAHVGAGRPAEDPRYRGRPRRRGRTPGHPRAREVRCEGRLLDGELHERLRLLLGTLAAESVPAGVSAAAKEA